MTEEFTITVGDCTDHGWNMREKALDYAAAIGAKQIRIVVGRGAERLPWLQSLAGRYGPEWMSDEYGDQRTASRPYANILLETGRQFRDRMLGELPDTDYGARGWS